MAQTDPRALREAIVQTVNRHGSDQLKGMVGALNMSNLAGIGQTILNYDAMTNEFTNMLCKIAEVWIRQKNIRNPLSILKRATPSPLGLDIEEAFVNPAKEKDFDPCGTTLLACNNNDTKVAYHRRSREGQYEAYVSRAQMLSAFTSWGKLDELVQSIVNSLFDGNRNSEWMYSKALFGQGATDGVILEQNGITRPTDDVTGRAFVKKLRSLALNMQLPGSSFNAYSTLPNSIGEPAITQTRPEDLILILRTDVLANIDVDVLARAFNLSYSDFIGRVLQVDYFTNADGTVNDGQLGFIGDQNVPVIVTQHEETSTFWNAQALRWTYYYTIFQIWSLSPFWNGMMLTE